MTEDRFSAETTAPLTAICIISGMLLAIFAQAIYAQQIPESRFPALLLLIIGISIFAIGAYSTQKQGLIAHISDSSSRLSAIFQISTTQLWMLVLALIFTMQARIAAGDDALAHHAIVAVGAWGMAIGLVVCGSWRSGDKRFTVSRSDKMLIIMLFIAAFLVRGIATNDFPTTLSGDEASGGFSSIAWLEGKADNAFSIGWFSFPSLFYALNAVGIGLLGSTPAGLRLFASIVGALTVAGVYGLGRGLFGRKTALIAACYLLASHYHIHFSRIGLQNIWDGLFFVVALAALWHGWQLNQRIGFIICGVALGLSQYFYVTARALPAIVLVWSLMAAIVNWQKFKQRFPDLLLSAYISVIIYLPLALFFANYPAEFYAPLQRVTIWEGWLAEQASRQNTTEFSLLLRQVAVSAQGITSEPLQHWYNVGTPLLLPIGAALFLLGLMWAIITFDLRHLLILLPLMVVVVAGALSRDAPASQRYVVVAPMAALLVALPLAKSAEWLNTTWPQYKRTILGVLSLLVLLMMGINLRFYFTQVYDEYTLGGFNTETAMVLAEYLQPQEPHNVYFFGLPRMGYRSINSVPFLAPQHNDLEMIEPISNAPSVDLRSNNLFIFLPERIHEMSIIQAQYPHGHIHKETQAVNGELYFVAYQLQHE